MRTLGETMSSLLKAIVDSVHHHRRRTALIYGEKRYSYQELACQAGRVAGAIAECGLSQKGPVGLMADTSLTAYTGVVAILAAGRPFVAIDPAAPPRCIRRVVDELQIDTLVVGPEAVDRLEMLLRHVGRPLAVVVPQLRRLGGIDRRHQRHRYRLAGDLPAPCLPVATPASSRQTACISYSSGTTGVGEPVAISHANVCAYLEAIDDELQLTPQDRCSHVVPLTSQLSIHDLFVTWSAGATLVRWGGNGQPERFIEHQGLTCLSATSRLLRAMDALGELSPGRFRTLRHSLVVGEPLAMGPARRFCQAAPNSSLLGLHGPAEAAVAVGIHRFDPGEEGTDGDPLPIGRPLGDSRFRVVGDDGTGVGPGMRGRLFISSPQLAVGYAGSPRPTSRRFVRDQQGHRWFRSRSVVERTGNGDLVVVGRLDDTVWMGGHRVDLSAVERAVRRACGHRQATVVGWPPDAAGARELIAFVADEPPVDMNRLRAACRRWLPAPLVPRRIVVDPHVPVDPTGDVDRNAIDQFLRRREVSL